MFTPVKLFQLSLKFTSGDKSQPLEWATVSWSLTRTRQKRLAADKRSSLLISSNSDEDINTFKKFDTVTRGCDMEV